MIDQATTMARYDHPPSSPAVPTSGTAWERTNLNVFVLIPTVPHVPSAADSRDCAALTVRESM